MSGRAHLIVRGVTLQVGGRVAALVLAFVTVGLTARHLGTVGYGALTTAIVFAGLFGAFTDLGVGPTIVRRVATDGADLPTLVGLNVGLSLAYALPVTSVAVALAGAVYGFDTEAGAAAAVVAVGVLALCLATCFDPVFDVHVRYTTIALSEVASRGVALLATVAAVALGSTVLVFALIQLIAPFTRLVLTYLGARRLIAVRPRFDVRAQLRLLRSAVPFALMIVIGVVYWRADGVILSIVSDPVQVAGYGIAVQVAFSLIVLPNVIMRSALSTMSQRFRDGDAVFVGAVDRLFAGMLLLASPVAVFGALAAGGIVRVVASSAFVEVAGPALALFFVAVSLEFLANSCSVVFVAAGRARFLATVAALSLGLNLGANLLLAPSFGARGAGIALVATDGFSVAVCMIALHRRGIRFPGAYLARLAPGLVAGGVVVSTAWPVLVTLPAAGALYLACAFACGALPPSVRAVLWAAGSGGRREGEGEVGSEGEVVGEGDRRR